MSPLLLVLFTSAVAAAPAEDLPVRPWSAEMLKRETAWPHAKRDARIRVTDQGLRVEVAEGRTFAIAAASRLLLPANMGRIRVEVSNVGNGAEWFLRLYGELRQVGQRRTVGVAQDETTTGVRVFELDPRLRQLPDVPLQLQLGVEGEPGAFTVFRDVSFLPARSRPNCTPRTIRQPGQRDVAAVELMPNLPEPYALIDWRAKALAYDRFVFDLDARGPFLPLAWLDRSQINMPHPTFGMS